MLADFLTKGIFIAGIFFSAAVTVFAQTEFSNWYFGNGSGLSFQSNKPSVLSNGNLYTDEGCSSISDSTGNLLFYTNGLTVWGNDHLPLINGTGLLGGLSSTQSALIIPKPGNKKVYYLFTVDENAGPNGFSYSVIESITNLKGAIKQFKINLHYVSPDLKVAPLSWQVSIKNQTLITPVSEKLTAIKHKNKQDYWIITHKWNTAEYYVFPLTENGIGSPVISSIGSFHGNISSTDNDEAIGYIQPSHDGSKIASVICYRKDKNIEIFDFDNNTGKLTNPLQFSSDGFAYGLCFSPDNRLLYVSFFTGPDGVVQYDLNAIEKNSSFSNFTSKYSVTNNEKDYTFGAMQLGPDGNIYIARVGKTLDVIRKPNKVNGKSKYQKSFIVFNDQTCTFGLPNCLMSLNK